jgi:WD40 repeat protein
MNSSNKPENNEKKQDIKPIKIMDIGELPTHNLGTELQILSNGYVAVCEGSNVNRTIKIYDKDQKQLVDAITLASPSLCTMIALPRARLACSDKNGLRVWDAASKTITKINNLHIIKMSAVADTDHLVCRVFNPDYKDQLITVNLASSQAEIKSLCEVNSFTTWGEYVLTSHDNEIKFLNLQGQQCGKMAVDEKVIFGGVDKNFDIFQNYLLAVSIKRNGFDAEIIKVRVFDLEKKQLVSQCGALPHYWDIKLLSPKRGITAHDSGISYWDLETGKEIETLYRGSCFEIGLSSDSKLFCLNHDRNNSSGIDHSLIYLDMAPRLRKELDRDLESINELEIAIATAIPSFPSSLCSLTREYVVGSWASMFPSNIQFQEKEATVDDENQSQLSNSNLSGQ